MCKREMTDWEREVKHRLIDRNMTVPELAAQIGISTSYIHDIFSGARKATDKKAAINKYLGIDSGE